MSDVKAAIDAFSALTADALKAVDEAALDRLQELAARCGDLVSEGSSWPGSVREETE